MAVLYIDTSAALKRVVVGDASAALREAMVAAGRSGDVLVTSTLTRVEISRALRRREASLLRGTDEAFRAALQGISQAPITDVVIELARVVGSDGLRSLDAIHLATAQAVGAHEMWTFDAHLAAASGVMGVPARMPGAAV